MTRESAAVLIAYALLLIVVVWRVRDVASWLTGYAKDVPSTNLRILTSLGLAVLIVVTTLVLIAIQRAPSLDILLALLSAVTAWMGLDVAQFSVKRKTHVPGVGDESGDG